MDDATSTMHHGELPPSGQAASQWGPFRLIEKVGQGAFGEVYRAFDTTLERDVAVKLLRPRGLGSEEEVRSVLREARLIAKVRHPNVVPVHGVDRYDGRVGFWSDFVRGRTLAALLRTQGPFGPREAAMIGIELAQAVSAVHAAGLLHRDIKSGNAMREQGGRILLMDFGITSDRDEHQETAGTPAYMAPELFCGERASVATDIYALGVVLFELLTGKVPYAGANAREVRQSQEAGARLRLLDARPDLPEPLARVVETAVDRDPSKRYSSAGLMIAALSDSIVPGTATPIAVPRRFRPWMLAPAAGLVAVGIFFTPARELLPLAGSGASPASGAHRSYLQAQDLIDHYYRPGATAQAIPLFEKTIAQDPKFALAYAGLARAHFLEFWQLRDPKSVEPAEAAASTALSLDRNLASVHVTLCRLYTETGRNDLAAQEASEALRLDARSAEAHAALAELYYNQGRAPDVEPTLQKAIDLAPQDWRFADQLGYVFLRTGRFEQAAAQYGQAIALSPDNPRPLTNLAISYQRLGRVVEAREALEKAIRIEPTYNRFNNLGVILEREGKYEEAAAAYRKALEKNPSGHTAWGNLAYMYRLMGGQESQALDAYSRAIAAGEEQRRSRPKDATLLAVLGSTYAAIGKEREGLPLLRQAAALAPEDPTVLYLAAQGNEVLHHREAALNWIGKALAAGFSRESLERDARFTQLRTDPSYLKLVTHLAAQHQNRTKQEK